MYGIIHYLNLITLTGAVFFGWKHYAKSNLPTKIFTITFSLVYLIQISSFLLARFGINNLLLFHFYFAFQLIGYGLFYWKILNSRKVKMVFLLGLILCVGLIGYEYSSKWNNLSGVFGGYSYFSMNLLFVFASIFHLVNGVINNQEEGFRFINYGMVVYLGGSSIIFLLGESLSKIEWKPILLFNVVLFMIFQVFYFLEIWKVKSS
ncbi:hypothetical protein IFO69_10040 [Echinicola sp. CAU 1574]|uniref:YhhN-like protein n=1 Tax=Echinicola arenosa TaxID=2774144 RepID=A0ABR9AJV7_9BACT|nr:hypothetical protein [Echinicola arenosa]MBD8489086.1 hypothetical protein [Echinicola arenosa]